MDTKIVNEVDEVYDVYCQAFSKEIGVAPDVAFTNIQELVEKSDAQLKAALMAVYLFGKSRGAINIIA